MSACTECSERRLEAIVRLLGLSLSAHLLVWCLPALCWLYLTAKTFCTTYNTLLCPCHRCLPVNPAQTVRPLIKGIEERHV